MADGTAVLDRPPGTEAPVKAEAGPQPAAQVTEKQNRALAIGKNIFTKLQGVISRKESARPLVEDVANGRVDAKAGSENFPAVVSVQNTGKSGLEDAGFDPLTVTKAPIPKLGLDGSGSADYLKTTGQIDKVFQADGPYVAPEAPAVQPSPTETPVATSADGQAAGPHSEPDPLHPDLTRGSGMADNLVGSSFDPKPRNTIPRAEPGQAARDQAPSGEAQVQKQGWADTMRVAAEPYSKPAQPDKAPPLKPGEYPNFAPVKALKDRDQAPTPPIDPDTQASVQTSDAEPPRDAAASRSFDSGQIKGGDGSRLPDTVTGTDTSMPGSSEGPEKTVEQRQQDIKDKLTAFGLESKIDTPEVQEALADPDKMAQFEKIVELTKSTVDGVIALSEGTLTPEAVVGLAESQFSSIQKALEDAAKKVDPKSEQGKKLHWMIKLLIVLAAPVAVAAVGTAVTAGVVGTQMQQTQK